MKKVLLSSLLILLAVSFVFAFKGNVILIKGKVTDNEGKQIGINMQFKNSAGKIYPVKSNSIDGDYQQSIMSGEDYQIFVEGHKVIEPQLPLKIAAYDKYVELYHNIKLSPISIGENIFKNKLFLPNDSNVVDNKDLFEDLRDYLKFHKKLQIEVAIPMDDSKFKVKKIKIKSEEKKGKTITKSISIEEQKKELLDARISALTNTFKKYSIRLSGVTFVAGNSKTKKGPYEVIMKVVKIANV